MKKRIACLIAVMLVAVFFPMGNSGTMAVGAENHRFSIVATTFPSYDWVRQILGEHLADVELTLLLDNGIDLHSFQPSVEDMAKIANCDLFVYVGGESDRWVSGVLQTGSNPNRIVISLLEALGDGAKTEEIVEGMEADDHDHDDYHDHDEDDHREDAHGHDDHKEGELDEHVWLSLRNAQELCRYIAGKIGEMDSQNAAAYAANATQYQGALSALDGEYTKAMDAAAAKTLLFGDRFPFRYLADDYQLSYYAAFSGCSAETEASFATIVFLTGKLNELGLHSVMVTESADQSIAKTVIQNSAAKNQDILVLNSMQSVTAGDVAGGTTYLSLMESNLEALKNAVK